MAEIKKKKSGARYSAPALEKGLDILELLADKAEGISQVGIARQLKRTTTVIYRALDSLDRRGYIYRDPLDNLYRLTSRLFEMAHRHPPTKRLLETALPEMRKLAEKTSQSCHLSVYHEGRVLVLSEVKCPGFIGFSVQAGAQVSLSTTASGVILLAFQDDDTRQRWLEIDREQLSGAEQARLISRMKRARCNGFEQQASHYIKGVTDISCPVKDHSGVALAALTIPCIIQFGQKQTTTDFRDFLIETARRVSLSLGGCLELQQE